jgi:hypothetical protein
MESVRMLNDGRVTIPAGSDSINRGTATGVSIHWEREILLLRRNGRRGKG